MPTKLIAVMGATGAQGGAVVQALIAEPEFEVRALTRNVDSDKAKALASSVKEIVSADADDEASLYKAFKDCYGVFIVTNYWADMNLDHEIEQHHKIAAAAKKAGVKHVVLSTLEDSRPFVNSTDPSTWTVVNKKHQSYVPHFDGKGEAGKDFAAQVPTTLLHTCFYYENFIHFGMGPKKQSPTDPLSITFPMGNKKLPMNAVADIGKMAAAMFKDPSTINTSQHVVSEVLTCEEIANVFAKVLNQPVIYNCVDTEVYAGFGFPGAADLANMFRFKRDFNKEFVGPRNVEKAKNEFHHWKLLNIGYPKTNKLSYK